LDTLRPDIASVALLACHTRRALNALQSHGTNRTGWTRNALDTLRTSLTRRASWTALASVALCSSHTGDALLSCNALRSCNAGNAIGTCWPGWANGTRDTGDTLRPDIAAITFRARCTRHAGWTLRPDASSCARWPRDTGNAGDALRSRHARHTLRPSGSRFASRTGHARRSLRTSHASHALRSLRTSKANLRPRREITSQLPELAVTQRQHEHPGFTPQLRDRVTLRRIGNATKAALAVPCLMRGVRVRRVERHDRSKYVGSLDLRHETTRLTVPVIGYVER
jgi:hypothetical protein